MKGRAIADHLAHCSLEEAEEIQGDFLDEDIMGIEVESWKMYFDGATNQNGIGIGVILITDTLIVQFAYLCDCEWLKKIISLYN